MGGVTDELKVRFRGWTFRDIAYFVLVRARAGFTQQEVTWAKAFIQNYEFQVKETLDV